MAGTGGAGPGRLLVTLAAFVVLGIPLVAYLWESLNQLLAGRVHTPRVLLSVPLLAALGGLLWIGGRTLRRLATPPPDRPDEPDVSGTLFLVAVLLMVIFGGWITGYAMLLDR
jgi:hypothetical protein